MSLPYPLPESFTDRRIPEPPSICRCCLETEVLDESMGEFDECGARCNECIDLEPS